MNILLRVSLVAFLSFSSVCIAEKENHLFILSGQSNMARLNPGISFTPTVASAYGMDHVTVVKDAHGGQPIRRWYKAWAPAQGDAPKATGDLYERLMKKVEAASKGKVFDTVTFVWMQGERDAREQHGEVYAASLKGLRAQLAEDLGRQDINFVIGRLSDYDMANQRYPHWTMIREAQVAVASGAPYAAWVDTDDLNDGLNAKGEAIHNDLHYSVSGYATFGKRLAEASIRLIELRAGQTVPGASATTQVAEGEARPNIVLFLVDDMGLMDTSAPMLTDDEGNPERHPLNDWYRTPNMEKLAEKGIRFSHFYAHSVCSPSRISIMTGQNSSRHGATNWINPIANNRGEFGPPGWDWWGLNKKDLTLPRLLQGVGYRTIHVGKAHFGPKGHEGADPVNLGFDRNIGGSYGGHPGSYYGQRNYGKGKLLAVPHLEAYHGTDTYLTEALTLEANKEVTAAVQAQKPFFLNMSHYALHAPFQSDPRFAQHYKDQVPGKSPPAQAYATMVEGIDKSLGDIIENLKQLGVADNTLIIFTGDNGAVAPLDNNVHGYSSSAPLRGKKATHYEGGVRVPFICAWAQPNPEAPWQKRLPIASGAFNSQIATITDLLPTICSLAEVAIPDDYPIDGFDLKQQLAGQRNHQRSNSFLNHFPHQHRSSYYTLFIQDDWKVVYHYPVAGNPRYELYNLQMDPYEEHNLADQNPERLQTMIQAMKADMQAKGALYPVKDGKPLQPENR